MKPVLRLAVAALSALPLACGAPSFEQETNAPAEVLDPAEAAQLEEVLAPAARLAASLGSLQQGATAGQMITVNQKANDGSTLCLDVRDQKNADGTRAQLWTCANSVNQQFTVANSLVKVFGDKCLNVVGGNNADGAGVQIWTCNATDRNNWWQVKQGHLVWRGTNKCLDITNGQFKNGTALQIWTCNFNSANQTFGLNADAASQKDGSTPAATAAPSTPASSTTAGQIVKGPGTALTVKNWQQEVHPAYAFNNEQENYTDGGQNVSFAADGTATLVAKPTGGSSWSSARLSGDSMGALPWYLEATIRTPTGTGVWPAFWLTARGSWPQGGEIDIMEQINAEASTNISAHWGAQTGVATFNTHEMIANVDRTAPHRYGVWATTDGLQFYLDGKAVGSWVTFPAESNFATIASQMVPIVNLAMGGDWPGNAPQATGQQTMVVYSVTKDTKAPTQ